MSQNFFEQIGGRATVEKVNKIFYDEIYKHPWIGKYFSAIAQDVIEVQQTDFLQAAFGGPNVYCGKFPIPAHKHMMITNELFDLRKNLLTKALKKVSMKPKHIDHWLKIDEAFRESLVKKSIHDCEKRFATDTIVDIPNPH